MLVFSRSRAAVVLFFFDIASSSPLSFHHIASPFFREVFHTHIIVNISTDNVLEQFGRRHGLKLLKHQIPHLSVSTAFFEQNFNNLLSCMRVRHLLRAHFQKGTVRDLIGAAVRRLFQIFQNFVSQFDGAALVLNVTDCVRAGVHDCIHSDNIGSHVLVASVIQLLHLIVEIEGAFRFVALGAASVRC